MSQQSAAADIGKIDVQLKLAIMYEFTKTHENYRHDRVLCEVACMSVQFPAVLCGIRDGDLLAGRAEYLPVGFTPQVGSDNGLGYYFNERSFEYLLSGIELDMEYREKSIYIRDYWKRENTRKKVQDAYPQYRREAFNNDSGREGRRVANP